MWQHKCYRLTLPDAPESMKPIPSVAQSNSQTNKVVALLQQKTATAVTPYTATPSPRLIAKVSGHRLYTMLL